MAEECFQNCHIKSCFVVVVFYFLGCQEQKELPSRQIYSLGIAVLELINLQYKFLSTLFLQSFVAQNLRPALFFD